MVADSTGTDGFLDNGGLDDLQQDRERQGRPGCPVGTVRHAGKSHERGRPGDVDASLTWSYASSYASPTAAILWAEPTKCPGPRTKLLR